MSIHAFNMFASPGCSKLAGEVAALLGHKLSPCVIERFPDGEFTVRLKTPVRGHPVLLFHSLSPPVTDHLFQLLLLVDACRRAVAERIIAVVPYLGYARADKRHGRREAVAASMVARILQSVGLDHLITFDLHSRQLEGFYQIPVDTLTAVPVFCDYLRNRLPEGTVVVSPDEGRIQMAGEYARRLGLEVAVLQKHREAENRAHVARVVGDVRDRPCLIIDDMITTGETVARAVEALIGSGARSEIIVAATHGVFVEGARRRLEHHAVREIVVSDSIALDSSPWPKLTIASIAPLLAAAVRHCASRESMSDLFQ